jgi:decaprenylphospho-beta-D-ribofuranose 2-oxidase
MRVLEPKCRYCRSLGRDKWRHETHRKRKSHDAAWRAEKESAFFPRSKNHPSEVIAMRHPFSELANVVEGALLKNKTSARAAAGVVRRRIVLYPRKQLDIRWRDLAAGMLRCVFPRNLRRSEAELRERFAPGFPLHIAYTVRSSFDLCLQALQFPVGSEIVMSALTIREMADIARRHGLVPVPLDLNLETLAPDAGALEAAITPRTRALVIAHLFGARVPMGTLVAVAKRHELFVFEDCAQAFTGPEYTGHAETDAAMFSFGSIKTTTAIAGALVRLRDPKLLKRVQTIQEGYPEQPRGEYFRELFTHVGVKLFTIPLFFGLFYRACVALGKDFERVISAVRNLPEGEEDVSVIRKQPCSALVALLARRLRTFDADRLRKRAEAGAQFAKALSSGLTVLGSKAEFHSFWVFPVLEEAPERFATILRSHGFDATTAGSALSVIEPPADLGRKIPSPANLCAAMPKLLYLPVYPAVPLKARFRLQAALCEIQKARPHLCVADARRVYSACASTIAAPSTVSAIRETLEYARRNHLKISSMGTSHNLGGHAFSDGCVVLDMKRFQKIVSFDPERKRITVESGITWGKIQKAINPAGLAIQAMQSDNSFTVGGSLSSNAHGRDLHASTVIQSVLGFRIMLADGSVVSASRTENFELFRHVIGGYGLFGVILEADLALVQNSVFEQTSEVIPFSALQRHFLRNIQADPDAEFFIARPSIAPGNFLDDTIVTVWTKTEARRERVFALGEERNVRRDRFLFGLSRRYGWGKTLRWQAEKFLAKHPSNGGIVARNNCMRPPVSAVRMFDYNSTKDADVIQEFFVPVPRFTAFFDAMRNALRESRANLIGLTVRFVKQDRESLLSYAPNGDALAAVLYINEPTSAEGRAHAHVLIQRLIRLALKHGGTFYLTYARDVDVEDLKRAYPRIEEFFQAKRRFDPENRFASRFFQLYAEKFPGALTAIGAR